MADPIIRLKRSAVAGKRPTLANLPLGEVALNTYDGRLFVRQDTGGVGIATTIRAVNPWSENYQSGGEHSIYYDSGDVGIGTQIPTSTLDVNGTVTATSFVGNGSSITGITFDQLSDVTLTNVGQHDIAVYHDGEGWLNDPGASRVVQEVRNVTGIAITQAYPVYETGYNQGNERITIDVANANSSAAMPALGIIHDADLGNNSNGYVIISGIADGIDTSGYSEGDELYVAVGGGLTNTRPAGATALIQKIGTVLRSHATTGSILVQGAGRTNDVPNTISVSSSITAGDGFYGDGSGITGLTHSQVSGAMGDVVDDTTPQLGGNLDVNGNDITGTGNINLTGIGTIGNIEIDNTTIENTNFGGTLILAAKANMQLRVNSSSSNLAMVANSGGSVDLYHNNTKKFETASNGVNILSTDTGSSAGPELTLYRNSSSPAPGDYLGQIMFKGENSNGGEENYAKITGKISDETLGTEDGLIETAIKGDGSFTIVSRQRSDELQLINGVGLSVDGDSTFTGGIDVDGHTELDNVNVSGVVTASSFVGDGSGLTNISHSQVGAMGDLVDDTTPQLGGNLDLNSNDITGTGNINITGSGTFSGNVSIAGTLTYEDVTNVDSVGLITARSGVDVTGNITVTGTVDGRDIASDGSKLDGIESGATADQTAAEILTLIKTVDGAGSGLDADTLDNLGSGAFLRSNAADTATGDITFRNNKLIFDNTTFSTFDWQNYQADGGDLTWTVGGTSGPEMELESDGSNYLNTELRVGGSKVWTAGNDGTGSGLDADLLDGQQGSYYLDYNNLTNVPSAIGNADTVDNLHASSFLRSDANDTFTGNLANNGNNYITFGPNSSWSRYLRVGGNGYQGSSTVANIATTNGNLHLDAADGGFASYLNFYAGTAGVSFGDGNNGVVAWMGPDGDLWKGGADNSGSKYWHAGNDGSGSGLDADTLDGLNSGSFLRSDANDSATGLYYFAAGAYSSNVTYGGRSINTQIDINSTSMRGGVLVRNANDFRSEVDSASFMHYDAYNTSATSYAFRASKGTTLADTFWVKGDGTAYFADDVGIGTASPATKLNVIGDIQLSRSTTASDGAINFGSNTNNYIFGGNSSNVMAFAVNGSERLRIDDGGRLLVKTNSARTNYRFNATSITPLFQLESTGGSTSFGITRNTNSGNAGTIYLAKSRGTTVGSSTTVQQNDRLGSLSFNGADGTDLVTAARIDANVDGTPGTDAMPGRLLFFTTSDGASTPTERMRIDSSGNVGIGSDAPSSELDVSGNVKIDGGDGVIKIGDIAGGTSSTDSGLFFDNTKKGAIFTEVDGEILSYAINVPQIDSGYDNTKAGGIFRLDTRVGSSIFDSECFVVKSTTPGETGETDVLGVGLTTGDTYLSPIKGNVAIGTDTPGDGKLDVLFDTSAGNRHFFTSGGLGTRLQRRGDTVAWAMDYGFESNNGTNLGGFGAYGNNTGLIRYFIGSGYLDTKFVIESGGNVGIGTDNPGYKLEVNGDIKVGELGTLWFSDTSGSIEKIESTASALNLYADSTISFYESDANTVQFTVNTNTGTAYLQSDSDTYWYHPAANTHAWTTGGTERFRIGSDGFASFSANALGTTAGNTQDLLQVSTTNTNSSYLKIFEQRDVNGSDWTSSCTRIQKVIDVTPQAYIQFNGNGNTYGMEFGTIGDEKFAVFERNGAVELYYDDAKKFETTSTGVTVTGLLSATTKSFVIDHPTKEGMKLRHGSLEGPENGVYIRGRLKDNNTIELPDYWTGLVDEETITVNLTPIGRKAPLHSVVDIADNTVVVESANDIVDCFYTVFGERKDVERFEVEF